MLVQLELPMQSEKELSTRFEAILITSPRGCSEHENRYSEAVGVYIRLLEEPGRSARRIGLDSRGRVRRQL